MNRDFDGVFEDSNSVEAARLFLSNVGIKTVKIPKSFLTAVDKFKGSANVDKANASSLRKALKFENNSTFLENQTRETKLLLLEFAMSDEKFGEMNGIKLIPLAGGSFGRFGSDHPVFVDSDEHPRRLLPLLKDWFVDKDVPRNIWTSLEKAAKMNSMCC